MQHVESIMRYTLEPTSLFIFYSSFFFFIFFYHLDGSFLVKAFRIALHAELSCQRVYIDIGVSSYWIKLLFLYLSFIFIFNIYNNKELIHPFEISEIILTLYIIYLI